MQFFSEEWKNQLFVHFVDEMMNIDDIRMVSFCLSSVFCNQFGTYFRKFKFIQNLFNFSISKGLKIRFEF